MNVCSGSSGSMNQIEKNLPTPSEVRAASTELNPLTADRPRPVFFPSIGVVVKFGTDVTITEACNQIFAHRQLRDKVPVPEVFAWLEDGGQVFIYMSLIEGDTLDTRWAGMNDGERQAVCKTLNAMVEAWRPLQPNEHEPYIGSIDGRPLNEIMLQFHPERLGPFRGINAIEEFHRACGIYVTGATDIAFTHNDLIGPNILLTRGPNPTVAAIIDWAQSGWYPAYWEYCKARCINLDQEQISWELQEEWREKYLPLIVGHVDYETVWYPWKWFQLSTV